MFAFDNTPTAFHDELRLAEESLQDAFRKQGLDLPSLTQTQSQQLTKVLVASPWCAEMFRRHPDWLLEMLALQDASPEVYDANYYRERLEPLLSSLTDEDALAQQLRWFRHKEQVAILWREFNRHNDTEATIQQMSHLADVCIDEALSALYRMQCKALGTPLNGHSEPQQLVVVGMGKLGACELNVSSDVDLIFAYPEDGTIVGGQKDLTCQEFFTRLGKKLIKALDHITADGFVFRVDMRLRPYGQSGALVLSFDALEEYYQDQGRDWERYAMIKARVVAGDKESGHQLLERLRPFVFRRYIDFSVIDSLRDMKSMIQREVKRRGQEDNVKLGFGGIREIEFIVQAFQLIRGGRDERLQARSLLSVLPLLVELDVFTQEEGEQLLLAYRFLRDVEHALQGAYEQQTQLLPSQHLEQLRTAYAMGFASWEAFSQTLLSHREVVQEHFSLVIAPPEAAEDGIESNQDEIKEWQGFWLDELSETEERALLNEVFDHDSQRLLLAFRDSRRIKRLQKQGLKRLNRFMPLLLQRLSEREAPSALLARLLPLIEAVTRRTAYLVLLEENPIALEQLMDLCGQSAWIAEQLTSHPVLLDELIDTRSFYIQWDKKTLHDELQQQLLRYPTEDLEAQMDGLRYFKLAQSLRIAAGEVTGHIPLMKVSDHLTWMAEVILEQILTLAWEQMTGKHGVPKKTDGTLCDLDFIIVAYGKLGGIELGHGSDLDLVFIHNGDINKETNGTTKPIDGGSFFNRLGQRIIHMLSANTPMGSLYEVDMRLRPSGNSGLLVSTLASFAEYQQKKAWTWEHQALVRARVVVGCPTLTAEFEEIRHNILCKVRNKPALANDVVTMREKMREHLLPHAREEHSFDLKQSEGGIVDIEFMVQYAVLLWAHSYPKLTRWSDNIRIIEQLEEQGLFSSEGAQSLISAYKSYRAMGHRLSLQRLPLIVSSEEFLQERRTVMDKWALLFAE